MQSLIWKSGDSFRPDPCCSDSPGHVTVSRTHLVHIASILQCSNIIPFPFSILLSGLVSVLSLFQCKPLCSLMYQSLSSIAVCHVIDYINPFIE